MAAEKRALFRLVTGRSGGALGEALGRALGVEAERMRVERFANENLLCEAAQLELEGADVVYVQTSAPPVNENLVEALLSLDAIRAARPRRLTALLPYLPYARSDRPETPEGPVQARLIAELLECAGADRIVAVDLHSPQLVGFYRIPALELSALHALVSAIRAWRLDDPVIVSPDLGGAKRAGAAAAALGVPLVLFRKQRRGREVTSELLGEVANRSVVIFDDEIATGGTMIAAARIALVRGARAVSAAATHAVFAGDVLARLAQAGIERVLVSDTIPLREAAAGKLEVVSVAPALAEALTR
ncbi:MAG: ribose-phosphate diphosphokinase [Myxococcota bacterium]